MRERAAKASPWAEVSVPLPLCSDNEEREWQETGAKSKGPKKAGRPAVSKHVKGINPSIPPSGNGCVECLAENGWWLHLRRCTECGHIGCCDDSLKKHATAHSKVTGHPIIASFEPGEDWFYSYETGDFISGPHLAEPRWHPKDQPAPGPRGRVPADWKSELG